MVTCSKEKELFLAACQADDCQSFLEFLEKHKSKSDDFNISDMLLSVSRKQHEKLWSGLFDLCARTLAKLNPSADPIEQSTLDVVLKCLQGIVTVGTCCLGTEKPVIVDKMLETMTVLHGVLLDLPDSASKLQHNIAKLCHTWWSADLPERELLVPNTIMYLLVKTLQPSGMVSDVKLLCSMRESFSQLNLADESSSSLKELLEQCIINSTFLKNDDGRKFLSFIFCLDSDLAERLHSAIKNQLPSCPKSMINYYGEVYFKAWRNSAPPVTAKLETYCIQDLMHCAVHARRVGTRNLSLTLRQLLSYFTKQKRQQGVDRMLLTLYQPILWRAFKVANASVRANAAALLIDAFPLQDPEANKEETDALLQKQIDILQGFLQDPCPVLRVTGVQGVCRILGMFWELIPAHVLTTFLSKLIQDMAFDASSSDVRVSVFKGLMFVIDNPLSHPLLKNLLPSLKSFIHDTSEKVILAFVDLLLKVKGLKTIKVWSIVPVEDLLARLEMDSPPVSRRLVQLLFKSFQPTDRDASVQIERVMALICMNGGAARVFYQYAHKHMSVDTAADFMLLLSRCVRGCVNQEEHHNSLVSAGGDASTEEEEEEEKEGLSLKDTDVIDGMLEIIAILWTGIAQQLAKPVNQTIMQKLVHRFGKDLPRFIATFKDGRSLSAVLILVSFLPASSIPAFSHSCLSKLKSMDPLASSDAYSPLIQCLVSWGKGNDVIRLISDWLEAAINQTDKDRESEEEEEESEDQMSGKLKKKKVTFNEPLKPQPRLALAYLDWLLSNYSCRTLLLDTSGKPLKEMATILKCILPLIEKRLMNPGPLNDLMSDEMLVSIIEGYCRISIHLQSLENSEPSSPTASESSHVSAQFDELLAWCDRELLSALPQSSGEECSAKADEGVRKLAKDCLMVVLRFACDVVTLGLGSDSFCSHLADFCHLVLKTEDNVEFVPLVAKVMCHLGRGGSVVDTKQQDLVADLFTKFIKAVGTTVSQEEKDTTQIQQTLSSIKPAVSDILRNSSKSNVRFHDDVLASSMAACVGEMTNTVAKSEGTLDAAQSSGDLPFVSGFLVGVVSSNKELLRSFVYELERCVSVGALQTYPALLAALHILHPLSQDKRRGGGGRGCGIKECLTAVKLQMDKLQPSEDASKDQDEDDDDGPNDHNRFMFDQMQSLEKQISEAIGAVA
ncbi:condensin-2 complex subunit G2 [Strongylocentrotus purpuratus]|uniref:Condensin-2 complex subunit G2 n=1 Tax=Strongylocentrotus purpuratus TaxID=7668 RepID=A0A7M7PVQ3_STRPU|nr:condensin-2 complex subunit G2 [Strongylocentrotus purpuratus]